MLKKIFLSSILMLPLTALGNDSSTTATRANIVTQSRAVIIRVPIDKQGREYPKDAETRVYVGKQDIKDGALLEQAWKSALLIDKKDFAKPRRAGDSSTHHHRGCCGGGYGGYYGYGWGGGWGGYGLGYGGYGYGLGYGGYGYGGCGIGYSSCSPYAYGLYSPYYSYAGGLLNYGYGLAYTALGLGGLGCGGIGLGCGGGLYAGVRYYYYPRIYY